MANTALAEIDTSRTVGTGVLCERPGPGHVLRGDIDDRGLSIDGGTAPFRSAIKTRKHHRVFAEAKGDKLPVIAEGSELFDGPAVRFRGPQGQKLLGQILPGEGRRPGGERLGRRGPLAGQGAPRIFAIRDRKKRISVRAIKEVDKSLFGGLRDGVDSLAIAFDGEKGGRGRQITVPEIVAHGLEMPDSFSGLGIESQQTVRE